MEQRIRINNVIKQYFKNTFDGKIKKIGLGLIHQTFFLQHSHGDFILQKMNHHVFKNPELVNRNIQMVSNHLKQQNYPKQILDIRPTLNHNLQAKDETGAFWRLLNYIPYSQDFSKAKNEQQVFETGQSFGEFLLYLRDLPSEKIQPSIPDFHHVNLRFQKLQKVIHQNKLGRVKNARLEIDAIKSWQFLIKKFDLLNCPTRIVHADPKINNLLFDKDEKVIAVIDWDTIMPGNILLDFGDLVRTTCCEEDEESINFSKVKISPMYLNALTKGFLQKTKTWITREERAHLMLGAQVIIYEQAIRFLTDYLEGDVYYAVKNPIHNLNRTINQIKLLESLTRMTS